jgi:cob(I)alamin adenosyltransferase
MKIYTKTGDAGETGLFGGPRVSKDSPRIEAYGTVDELNGLLGLARTESLPVEIEQMLAKIQNHLFDLGAELASPDPDRKGTSILGEPQIAWQEGLIDGFETELAPLRAFILPGGTKGAALLHMARCVCRRAERCVVTLHRTEPLSTIPMMYLNRLSDLLFVAARLVNHRAGIVDVPWEKST